MSPTYKLTKGTVRQTELLKDTTLGCRNQQYVKAKKNKDSQCRKRESN